MLLPRLRPALLLLALLTLWFSSAEAQDPATDEPSTVDSGGLSLKVHTGYGNTDYAFALPVPNAALARQGAANTGLAWQLAYNYSVVPVQVSIEHRLPSAFKGRIEVECRNSVSRSETSGNPVLLISREVIVPPASPLTVTLLPRVTPPVSPGTPIWLTVRLFQGENEKPVSVERSYAYQLEPYYLYTLHLDAADDIVADAINPDNALDFRLNLVIPNFGAQPVSPQLLSSELWHLPTPHQQVTTAPLAARDFAFVCASLPAVQAWSDEDQAGLESFLDGGGHLCLYNCAGQERWHQLDLGQPGSSGRGILLPVGGDFQAARRAMRDWIEGELSEFVLLSGGSVTGFAFNDQELPDDERLSSRLNLSGLLGLYRPRLRQPPPVDNANGPYESPKWPPYEAGYLNPLWTYRESCRLAAREPWDYPQFSQPNTRYLSNSYFNLAVQAMDDPDEIDIPSPLNQLARAARHIPWQLGGLMLPVLFFAALSLPQPGRRQRLHTAVLGLLLCGSLGCCIWGWLKLRALSSPGVRLDLIDLDANSGRQLRRSLLANTRSGPGELRFDVPQDALLRRISQDPAGDLNWETTRPETWRKSEASIDINGGADFMALALEAAEEPDPALHDAVAVKVQRTDGSAELRLDTSRLPEGSSCLLQTPLGWMLVPSGDQDFAVHLELPRLPAVPGPERLQQWARLWRKENRGWPQQLEMASIGEQSRLLLSLRGELAGGLDSLPRLAWLGLLAQPLSGLAACELASGNGQAVLWVALPQTQAAVPGAGPRSLKEPGSDSARHLSFLRYSFPLETRQ